MKQVKALGVLLVVGGGALASGCTTSRSSSAPPTVDLGLGTTSPPLSDSSTPRVRAPATVTLELFFPMDGDSNLECKALDAVAREVPFEGNRANQVLDALLVGPNEREAAINLYSPLRIVADDGTFLPPPKGTIQVSVIDGTAVVRAPRAVIDELVRDSCAKNATMTSLEESLIRLPDVQRVELTPLD